MWLPGWPWSCQWRWQPSSAPWIKYINQRFCTKKEFNVDIVGLRPWWDVTDSSLDIVGDPLNEVAAVLVLDVQHLLVHLHTEEEDGEDEKEKKIRRKFFFLREAITREKCSFFEHCSKGLWPPPPFIWTFVLFCRGCFLKRVFEH